MPVRNNQRKAVGDREAIPEDKDVAQPQEDPLRIRVAEGTPARVVVGCAGGHSQGPGVVSGYWQIGSRSRFGSRGLRRAVMRSPCESSK